MGNRVRRLTGESLYRLVLESVPRRVMEGRAHRRMLAEDDGRFSSMSNWKKMKANLKMWGQAYKASFMGNEKGREWLRGERKKDYEALVNRAKADGIDEELLWNSKYPEGASEDDILKLLRYREELSNLQGWMRTQGVGPLVTDYSHRRGDGKNRGQSQNSGDSRGEGPQNLDEAAAAMIQQLEEKGLERMEEDFAKKVLDPYSYTRDVKNQLKQLVDSEINQDYIKEEIYDIVKEWQKYVRVHGLH